MKPTAPSPPEPRNFFQDVHEVVRLVPKGRVTTYGAIAHYLDTSLNEVAERNLTKLFDRKARGVIKSKGDNR